MSLSTGDVCVMPARAADRPDVRQASLHDIFTICEISTATETTSLTRYPYNITITRKQTASFLLNNVQKIS